MDHNVREFVKEIYDTIGYGHTENIYHKALEVLLRIHSIPYESERIVPVEFKGFSIGNVRCDIIIDHSIIIELKTVTKLRPCDRLQLENYLKLTGYSVGYLVNFGPSLEVEMVSLLSIDSQHLENPSSIP
jgi:GxxExxY protein